MNKFLKILGLILLVIISIETCIRIISDKSDEDFRNSPTIKLRNEKTTAKEEIKRATSIMNSSLPSKIGEYSTFEKVEYLEDEEIFVFYIKDIGKDITNLKKEELDSLTLNLKKVQVEKAKKNPNKTNFKILNLTLKFIYVDEKEQFLTSYIITPKEY